MKELSRPWAYNEVHPTAVGEVADLIEELIIGFEEDVLAPQTEGFNQVGKLILAANGGVDTSTNDLAQLNGSNTDITTSAVNQDSLPTVSYEDVSKAEC